MPSRSCSASARLSLSRPNAESILLISIGALPKRVSNSVNVS